MRKKQAHAMHDIGKHLTDVLKRPKDIKDYGSWNLDENNIIILHPVR